MRQYGAFPAIISGRVRKSRRSSSSAMRRIISGSRVMDSARPASEGFRETNETNPFARTLNRYAGQDPRQLVRSRTTLSGLALAARTDDCATATALVVMIRTATRDGRRI